MTLTSVMDLVAKLSSAVTELSRLHERVVVAIDGPDCAGKTTVADQLATALQRPAPPAASRKAPARQHLPARTVPTLRSSVDGFNRPRAQRYARGELSAEGYYLDSFDYPSLLDRYLLPFLAGEPVLRTNIFDHRCDSERPLEALAVPAGAVLIVDGVFLLRPELRELWTLSVYLRVSPAETLSRAHRRDLELFGSCEEIERRYLGRYLPGQALYREREHPEQLAHILVDNEQPDNPRIERWNLAGVTSPAQPNAPSDR
jgi:uridine kinase